MRHFGGWSRPLYAFVAGAKLWATGIFLLAVYAQGAAVQGATCPLDPTPTVSATPPADVCIADFSKLPIQYFDDYSWRIFLSLVWPADANQRGQPDTALKLGD